MRRKSGAQILKLSLAHLLLATLFIALVPNSLASAEDEYQIKMVAGETHLIKFRGSDRRDYRWVLKKNLSSGIDLVSVEEVGWTYSAHRGPKTFRGRAGTFRMAIVAKGPGAAVLVFHYVNPNLTRPLATRTVNVVIDAASASIR